LSVKTKSPAADSAGLAQRAAVVGGLVLAVIGLYFGQPILMPIALATMLAFLLTPICDWLEKHALPRVAAAVLVMLMTGGILVGLGYTLYSGVNSIGENWPEWSQNLGAKQERLKSFLGVGDIVDRIEAGTEAMETLTGAEDPEDLIDPADEPADAVAATQPAADTTAEDERAARLREQERLIRQQFAPVETLLNDLLEQLSLTNERIDATNARLGEMAEDLDDLGSSDNPLLTRPQPPQGIFTRVSGLLGAVVGPIGTAGLVAVFALFILLERDGLRDKALRLVGGNRNANTATQAFGEAGTRISRYLIAQAIVNGTYGVAVVLGLLGIGYLVGGEPFPNFLLWGLLCAVLRFIPYLGPWLGASLPVFVSFAAFDNLGVFLAVAGMFIVIELWSNNLMEPWLYGTSTGMSPLSVLLAALFWTFLWGPVGLVLATPLTVCLVVLGKYVPQLKFLDIILRGSPVLSPETRVYQRLLALDQDEAEDVAEEFLNDHPVADLFDDVLLPALAMVERERHAGNLDESRQLFAHKVLRDMVDDLGDRYAAVPKSGSLDEQGEPKLEIPPPPTMMGGAGDVVTVPHALILPARDEADEIAGRMLAKLMLTSGYRVTVLPHDGLVSEMVDAVTRDKPGAVLISAVPPAGTTHSRYLLKKLVSACEATNSRVIVALWGSRTEPERLRRRLTEGKLTPRVASTLPDAVRHIREAAHNTMPTPKPT
jgi:predicted PurR-regulated permease PerM